MKTWILLLALLPAAAAAQTLNGILFPGDANNDGRANHVDLLAIALNFGKTGPLRSNPTINWAPKGFTAWPDSLPVTGVNAAFSDTNGDGTVNTADLQAVELNYDSTQNASLPPPKKYAPTHPAPTTARPKLVFRFDKDTATVNDTLRLDIYYVQPNALPAANSPMGVAFALDFDPALVKDSLTTIHFDTSGNDLLFAAAASGFVDTRAVPPGAVEFGAAGRRAPRLAFDRHLGSIDFIIVEVIVRNDTAYRDFKINVRDVLFLDTLERVFDYDIQLDSVVLYQVVDSFAVCPGDANNDGQVNHLDVLAIGMAYHQEGIPRDTQYQGAQWAAKPFHPWNIYLPFTKVDLAFADSDGNGFIDEKDVKAIQLNYDSAHHLAYPPSAPYTPPNANLPATALLDLHFLQTAAHPGDTLQLEVRYVPPENIPPELLPLGVAFALEFDDALVRDSLTRILFPPDNTLLVAGAATRFALARAVAPGRVEVGVAGKAAPALNSPRTLCTVELVLESALPAGHAPALQVAPAAVLMINPLGQSMTVTANTAEVKLTVATRAPEAPLPFRVFPSPARDYLRIESPEAPLIRVAVYNRLGQCSFQQRLPENYAQELSVASLPPGLYWLQAGTRDGRCGVQPFLKQ